MTLSNFMISLLALFLAVTTDGVRASEDEDQCSGEFQIKFSMLSGLEYARTQKIISLHEMQHKLRKMQAMLNSTVKEKTRLEESIQHLTSENETYYSCDTVPKDCCQIKKMLPSAKSGLYAIRDPCARDREFSSSIIAVNCDMETDGGGWTLLQRRNADMGKVNFVRDWDDYENGFGDLDGEFWIGLKNIYELTTQQRMKLRISVWNDTTNTITAWDYPYFAIQSPSQNYALVSTVGPGTGAGSYAPLPPINNNNRYFSTLDRDNDQISSKNCGYMDQGGWWYYDCNYANLNGRHQPTDLGGTRSLRQRLVWRNTKGEFEVYKHAEMKIRPQDCGLSSTG